MHDYSSLGLRVGLEIHQQLNSGHKLFCNCPVASSGPHRDLPLSVERKMRPAAGELEIVDPAALYEFFRSRKFVYRYSRETACLVELDEEPPRPINERALRIALQIAKLLRADIVDELHVMRKTVIDGSAVSGFQRTALLATNGEIDTSFGPLEIATVMLEEDSAVPVRQENDVVEYRLDRLGIPLVEIATSSDIHTPEQAREAAAAIGRLLRACNVVRGIGSIRQDVNVSIRDGARVEIKGFQDLAGIPDAVGNEVARQVALLEIKKELERRGFEPVKGFLDATDIFKDSRNNFLHSAVAGGGRVAAIRLPKFASLLAKRVGDRTFGKELSAYAAAYGFGIMHSDEDLEKYSLSAEFAKLRKIMGAEKNDAIVITAGSGIEKAVGMLIERINYCARGVPEETRVADGPGSKYTRPLPGSGRLYPESDIPAIIVRPLFKGLEIPKTLDERKKELDLPKELAEQIINSPYLETFEEMKKYGPVTVASALTQLTAIRREGADIGKINRKDMERVFSSVAERTLPKDAVPEILEKLAAGESLDALLRSYEQLSDKELRSIVKAAAHQLAGKKESVIMGEIMKKVRGRADGARVTEFLHGELKQYAKKRK